MIYLCLGLLVLLFLKGVMPGITNPLPEPNLFTLQAEAFLQGKLDIGQEAHDVALYKGRYYVTFPPFPALLLTPFVWLWGGSHVNSVLISTLLSVLNAWLLYCILRAQQISTEMTLWTVIGFFMGTAYWMAVKGSFGVWFFAHVVCVTALFLAIREALGSGRGWLTGLYFALAVLSRHLAVYTLPFFLACLWTNKRSKAGISSMLICSLLGTLPYLWMNWMRFDDPFNTGYAYILQTGGLKERLATYGLFHVNYIPFNFTYLFLQGFHVKFEGPLLLHLRCLDPFGTSLTFASPFLFAAFWAHWKRELLLSAWVSIILIILHTLLYYTNGYYQINAQRFTLDFLPLLILLTALGAQRCHPKVWKSLIVYSVALNVIASAICAFSP